MIPHLTLFEETFANGAAARLPPAARMLFLVHGLISVDDQSFADGGTWHGEGQIAIRAGTSGATLWRWELTGGPALSVDGDGIQSTQKLSAPLETLPKGELLFRGDSVGFPPGGCALTHVHQGPGIRCLVEGGVRIDTHGRSTSYGPGGAWFESGPDAVFAQAAADRSSRFIRVMILPRSLLGKSSIRYVNEADKDKPKSQNYQIFVDAPIAFQGRQDSE